MLGSFKTVELFACRSDVIPSARISKQNDFFPFRLSFRPLPRETNARFFDQSQMGAIKSFVSIPREMKSTARFHSKLASSEPYCYSSRSALAERDD